MITGVAEQRMALAASLRTLGHTVHEVPFNDPAPPCLMIGNPAYEVTSRTCQVTWVISVIRERTTPETTTSDFDSIIPPILNLLAKGVDMNFVVQSAAPRLSTPELPIQLPEYVIFGVTNIPLC